MTSSPRQASDLAVFVNARRASRRCPDKMLRPFAGTTVLDLFFAKRPTLDWPTLHFGAHEPELIERARGIPGVEVFRRSAESAAADADPARIFEILRHLRERWVCWINPCHVLLEMATVRRAIDAFLAGNARSMTAVVPRRGWFFLPDGRPIDLGSNPVDTAQAGALYEVAHAFHIYESRVLLEHGKPWSGEPGDPTLFPIPAEQAVDIDTEDEFAVAEWRVRRRAKGHDPSGLAPIGASRAREDGSP